MSYACINPVCKRRGKAFNNCDKDEENYFSYLQHCASNNACWSSLSQVDKDWWIEKDSTVPLPVGRPTKVPQSTNRAQEAVADEDTTFSINVDMNVKLDMKGNDTIDDLKTAFIAKMFDSNLQVWIGNEVRKDDDVLEDVLLKKKKNVMIELVEKPKERPRSPSRRGIFGTRYSPNRSGLFGTSSSSASRRRSRSRH